MRARELVVLAVLFPALALGASACGGSGAGEAKPTASQIQATETKWRAGLLVWRRVMLHALDGLSPSSLRPTARCRILSQARSPSSAKLLRFESPIATCSAKVRLLGPAPEAFLQSRIYALEACKRLNEGVGEVNQVVADLRHGIAIDPIDPLGNATVLLATGQTELSTAVDALDAPSA